uniref:DNA-directed DNA polymerase n=1 Tax=Tanacetum cinerariifolium TaxID=118510 RepID=A0A6L2LCJ7_TANCI|nr:DNA-directed DNA polymerase [Tanacetum cinerariifolium]
MEEMFYKFFDEGYQEHKEMSAFIIEFRTTNELLFKERNNLLRELTFEVYGLSKVINNALLPECEAKGVTTRGGKMTTQGIINDNTDIHDEGPSIRIHDKPDVPKEVLVEDEHQKAKEQVVQPSIEITLRVGDDEVIFDVDQSIKRPLIEDDECYGIDDLDEMINVKTHELLRNDQLDLFLLKGLEKSINRVDQESYDFIGDESGIDSDLGTPIQRIDPARIQLIYPIADSLWVSHIHVVLKKGGMTVVLNENNELIPSHIVTGWRVCIDYQKLNDATRKGHFPLPFIDQMLSSLSGNEYYCFLDGFSRFFQISIALEDQEKTTFTCPYGTFAYKRMSFGLCNVHATFQRCVTAIFHDMVEDFMEVFMDDFLVLVLGQRIDGKFKQIYYARKALNNAQEHYTTTEKELLVVVFSFDKFHPYLILSKLVVYTDHSALKYLFSKQDAKPRLIRLENPDLGVFTEEEIVDEFLDEHLMMLKAKPNDDEPCYADYVNYIFGKVVPPRWTPKKKKKQNPCNLGTLPFWTNWETSQCLDYWKKDVLVERVGSSFLRVILIIFISVEVLVALKVGAAAVSLPVGVLELDTHSSSEVNPLENSPPPVSIVPMVLPFLCLDDSKSDTEIPQRHVSPTTSTTEIPIAPILPAPPAILAPPSKFPLAPVVAPPGIPLRYTSHHLDRFTSGSSSSHSSSNHSLSGHSSLNHSLSRHTPPETTDADSSTPQRFINTPLARTPRCSEAYLRWRSAPLSTMYPPTTSESSAGDSSSESSTEPSRKRCRSLADIVTSSIHSKRGLVPSCADLRPPRKRFRDSFSPEDCVEEDINTDMLEDIEADATAVEVAVDRNVESGIDAAIGIKIGIGIDVEDEVEDEVEFSDRGTMEVGLDMDVRIYIPDGMLMSDAVERLEQVEEGFQNIHDHVIEIPLQRIEDIETAQR